MPPIAAVAVPIIMSATVAGVATGALVVGAGLTIASKITGSKLLGKIGMGLSLAGGVGGLAAGAAGIGGMTLGEIGGSTAIGMGETAASSVMSAETLGIGAAESGTGSAMGTVSKSMGTLNKAKEAKQASDTLFSPDSDSYKRFEMASNIIGGMAEGSDDEADRQMRMDLQNDQQKFENEQRDYRHSNLNELSTTRAQRGPGIRLADNPPLRAPQPLARIR